MTILHRSTAAANVTGSAAASLAITPGTSPTLAGSTLVLGIAYRRASATVNTPTDSASNTWVKITGASQDVSPQYEEIWWCANAAAVTSVTANFSGTGGAVITLTEVTGLGTSPAVDVTQQGSGSSTTPATGTSAATAVPAEFALAFTSWLSATGTLAGSGSWTNLTQAHCAVASDNISGGVASQVLSSTGTQSFTGSGITSSQWHSALVTFQPGATGTSAGFLGILF